MKLTALIVSTLGSAGLVVLEGDTRKGWRLGKAIMRRRDIALSPEESELATRWAPLVASQQKWTAIQSGFLMTALVSQNLGSAFGSDEFRPFNFWLAIAVVALVIVLTPFGVVEYRRVARHAREHPPQQSVAQD